MTPEQLKEYEALLARQNEEMEKLLLTMVGALKVASQALKQSQQSMAPLVETARRISPTLAAINKRAKIDYGHAASHGGAAQRILHKRSVGIIRPTK